jgi:hypothetical protein
MGAETEYAAAALTQQGAPLPQGVLLSRLFRLARQRTRHLMGGSLESLFLSNGARMYADRGPHAELATPECRDPWQVVRYVRAGERLLSELASALATEPDLSDVKVFRTNVDYHAPGVSWGCHESYLCRTDLARVAEELIPHLVSRIVFTGAGGFVPGSPGLEFTLSPRACFVTKEVSAHSMGDRGIFHTKDEPLARAPNRRVHVLCGESVCSDLSGVLKYGTTALVIALVDAGERPGEGVALVQPVSALRRIAGDPTCRTAVRVARGQRLTAIEIQRHYLRRVEGSLERLPDWAPALCALWRTQLDALERGPAAVARCLDWALKQAIYARFADGLVRWDEVQRWSRLSCRLFDRIRTLVPRSEPSPPFSVNQLLDPTVSEHPAHGAVSDFLARHGASREDVERFLALRSRLHEAELRFGQLGGEGTFDRLDRAGLLEHRLIAGAEIEGALDTPPGDTRARARGAAVAAMAGTPGWEAARADWAGISDVAARRELDLSDPFATQAEWKEMASPRRPVQRPAAEPSGDGSTLPDLVATVDRVLSRRRSVDELF